MFNHIDPNNVPLSSSFYPSEQVHQNIEKKPLANRAITYLSEGSNISPELRNQKNKLVTIKLETSFQIDLPPISKAISQIKSEIPPQKQSLIIDPESSSQEIDQTEEEDLFSEEIDENIYNIRNESKSEALEEQVQSEENQTIGIAEQTTSNLIAEEKTFESKTLEDTSNSTNKASHKEQGLISSKGLGDGNVKIEKQPQEQSILFSQDHAKMNKTIEKIKMQSIHLRNLGNLSEVNRETSSSRIEGNGLQIQARMKEVNGVLDSVTTNTEYPVSFEKLFLSVVDDEQNQRKFHNILQAGCDGCKTFVHRKKYDVLENIVKKVAEKHLKQAVIDNGSVDLAEEELKDFAKRLFYEAIEEGAVIGPNGQPVKLSSEEIEAWQKEFAEFFISYLISKNLLKNQKQSREESKSITVNISLLSTTYKRESEIEDQLYFLTLLDRSKGLINDAIITQIQMIQFIFQLILNKLIDNKRKEKEQLEANIERQDRKLEVIRKGQLSEEILKGNQIAQIILTKQQEYNEIKFIVKQEQVNLNKKIKEEVSNDPDIPSSEIYIVDAARQQPLA